MKADLRVSSVFVLIVLSLGLFGFRGKKHVDYLDPPYPKASQPFILMNEMFSANQDAHDFYGVPSRSNTSALIMRQSPVKSQGARGTCSIFASTALLEAMLKTYGIGIFGQEPNLSEEWLEYLVVRNSTDDGSTAPANLAAVTEFGDASEKTLPYIGETWERMAGVAEARCGRVPRENLKGCLLGHYDPRYLEAPDNQIEFPEFQRARAEAVAFKEKVMPGFSKDFNIGSEIEVKRLLNDGITTVLELDFYYGAWNHGEATSFGIGRDPTQYKYGVVGFPEPGSVDLIQSRRHRAGHAIVVVGYDDEIEITSKVKMADGSIRAFTHKGVYFFKNSWGTDDFGVSTTIEGRVYPGYGMITQDYAHKYGQFFKLVALQH